MSRSFTYTTITPGAPTSDVGSAGIGGVASTKTGANPAMPLPADFSASRRQS
jgi:hypothetical protein